VSGPLRAALEPLVADGVVTLTDFREALKYESMMQGQVRVPPAHSLCTVLYSTIQDRTVQCCADLLYKMTVLSSCILAIKLAQIQYDDAGPGELPPAHILCTCMAILRGCAFWLQLVAMQDCLHRSRDVAKLVLFLGSQMPRLVCVCACMGLSLGVPPGCS